MEILKFLLATILAFNCINTSKPNFFKMDLSDLKAEIKEKLNSPLTAEGEKYFDTYIWQRQIVGKSRTPSKRL